VWSTEDGVVVAYALTRDEANPRLACSDAWSLRELYSEGPAVSRHENGVWRAIQGPCAMVLLVAYLGGLLSQGAIVAYSGLRDPSLGSRRFHLRAGEVGHYPLRRREAHQRRGRLEARSKSGDHA